MMTIGNEQQQQLRQQQYDTTVSSSSSSSQRIVIWIEIFLMIRMALLALRFVLPKDNQNGFWKLLDALSTLGLTSAIALQVAKTYPCYWKLQRYWLAISRNIQVEWRRFKGYASSFDPITTPTTTDGSTETAVAVTSAVSPQSNWFNRFNLFSLFSFHSDHSSTDHDNGLPETMDLLVENRSRTTTVALPQAVQNVSRMERGANAFMTNTNTIVTREIPERDAALSFPWSNNNGNRNSGDEIAGKNSNGSDKRR